MYLKPNEYKLSRFMHIHIQVYIYENIFRGWSDLHDSVHGCFLKKILYLFRLLWYVLYFILGIYLQNVFEYRLGDSRLSTVIELKQTTLQNVSFIMPLVKLCTEFCMCHNSFLSKTPHWLEYSQKLHDNISCLYVTR